MSSLWVLIHHENTWPTPSPGESHAQAEAQSTHIAAVSSLTSLPPLPAFPTTFVAPSQNNPPSTFPFYIPAASSHIAQPSPASQPLLPAAGPPGRYRHTIPPRKQASVSQITPQFLLNLLKQASHKLPLALPASQARLAPNSPSALLPHACHLRLTPRAS